MSSVRLIPELEKAFNDMGFSEWTDIQKRTIPLIQQGKDVIGQSHTGSGKTAAFGFPILEKVHHSAGIQVLVLVPTRELCEQVTAEMRKFAKYKRANVIAVYGGVSISPQISNLRHADIVIGTPGRTLDHLSRNTINLGKVKFLVLDEADKMFEMGFVDDVKRIISYVPSHRQTLLFSATISHQVQDIVKHYMKSPEKIKAQSYVDEGKLSQYFYSVNSRDKFSLMVHLLKTEGSNLTLIFCATRKRVDILCSNLYKQGIKAQKLHGGLTQSRRKQAIDLFHQGKIDVLVASDVASRGLDIKNVSHVINYDIPKTSKEYIHRIGRTARAGSEGKVISLLSEQDHDNFRSVLEDRSLVIEQLKLPEFERVPFNASGGHSFERREHGLGGRSHQGTRGHYGDRRGSFSGERRGHGHSKSPYSGDRRQPGDENPHSGQSPYQSGHKPSYHSQRRHGNKRFSNYNSGRN